MNQLDQNNQRHGYWVEKNGFFANTNATRRAVEAHGVYEHGTKVGEWKYYAIDGGLAYIMTINNSGRAKNIVSYNKFGFIDKETVFIR